MVDTNLYGLDHEGLRSLVARSGAEPFHAGQIYRWLYARRKFDPASWTDLPTWLRDRLREATRVDPGRIGGRTEAPDETVKYRIDLPAGGQVEAVYMVARGAVTMCLSSQVGCALGCTFCLTGKMGLTRHLGPGEIVGQAALIQEDRNLEDRPFNVVFMGMGEPLHNYDGTMAAFSLLTSRQGFGLSRRRVTVSTVGIAPAIERLARETARPCLAVSLNATTDAVRSELMPINRKYPLARLFEACRAFSHATRERFTFEYVLLAGVNDTDDDVHRLAGIVRSHRAKLNLIPFNAVPGWLDYRPPGTDRVLAVRDELLSRGVPVGVRWSRGLEARAACGQLALLPGEETA